MKEYGVRQNTYVLAHAYMVHKNSYTHIHIYPTNHSESLMRRKHEVNIIWIDSTIHILHIQHIPGALNCLEHTYFMCIAKKDQNSMGT